MLKSLHTFLILRACVLIVYHLMKLIRKSCQNTKPFFFFFFLFCKLQLLNEIPG